MFIHRHVVFINDNKPRENHIRCTYYPAHIRAFESIGKLDNMCRPILRDSLHEMSGYIES